MSVFYQSCSQLEPSEEKRRDETVGNIIKLFDKNCLKYISVFRLDRDPSLTDIIFKALDSGKVLCILSKHIVS